MKKEISSKQNLHAGHRERMRKKFIQSKGIGFRPHELLEMLLYYSIPRANTNETAHQLINQFGSLYALFTEGDYHAFRSVPGIGDKSALLLTLIGEMFKSGKHQERKSEFLYDYHDFCQFFLKHLQHEHTAEILMAVCLADNMQVVRCEKIESDSTGTLKLSLHQIAKIVFQSNCTLLVLAHNHPLGEAVPSYQDVAETKLLCERLKMLEIDLLDHIIIGNGEAYSMAEHYDF